MSASRNIETPAGFNPSDVYFVFFRHKKKIAVLAALGLIAAGVFYFVKQPLYQSDAEVFIRYISDNRTVNPSDNNAHVTSLIDPGVNVLQSEMQILGTYDLALEVATNVGPDKILAKYGGGSDYYRAASIIRGHLKVECKPDSSVISVTFRHPDPDVVRPVLAEVVAQYQEFHRKVHEAIGISDDSLSDETSKLRLEIAQTEDELRIAKTNAGIISLDDAEKSYQDMSSRIHTELFEARASLAEHQMKLQALSNLPQAKPGLTNVAPEIPPDVLSRYKVVCLRLASLQQRQEGYISQGYTDQNKLVKEVNGQIAQAMKDKAAMESQNPALAEVDASAPNAVDGGGTGPNSSHESEEVMALPLRIKELQAQMSEIQGEAARLNDAEARISDLERKKKIQEDNYQYFVSMLDQARIDEALGPGRVSNIKVIQQPSPPYKDFSKFYKTCGVLAFSGLLIGLAWAFLIEFYLDRSVKRPVDLQNKLHIPFFLSIPDLNHGATNRLASAERRQLEFNGNGKATAANGTLEVASPTVNHALHSHYDALRDRLVNYFESINLTRKPKLVAVTSPSKGAGVSTISAGLAASLSETGDGRVLLVDMNLENGAAQQFVRGKASCQLDDALVSDKRDNALVQENLYVVSEGSNADKLPRILPKRFASLVPKLKASDYDYIIFDMPPVTQTSVTTRLAGFMDTVMLVVEAEKTDRDVVQQAHQLLQQSKANVTAVLNKTRKYLPARLQHEIQADM
jgi:succinoglycan biosynthesis transport protein ExoP